MVNSMGSSCPVCHVLVVEDSKIAAMSVKVALKPFSCTVDFAENGAQAIKKAKNNTYSFVLMDIGLPDIDGIQVTKTIRSFSDVQKAQVPIFGLTGHANNSIIRQQCLEAGMQEVYTKPIQALVLDAIFQRFVFHPNTSNTQKKWRGDLEDNDELIIDWQGCVQMLGNNEVVTRELLSMISKELDDTRIALEKFYLEKNVVGLRAELHQILGGVVCARLPQLEQALKAFQAAIKAEPSDVDVWERTYKTLKKAMDDFQTEWKNGGY